MYFWNHGLVIGHPSQQASIRSKTTSQYSSPKIFYSMRFSKSSGRPWQGPIKGTRYENWINFQTQQNWLLHGQPYTCSINLTNYLHFRLKLCYLILLLFIFWSLYQKYEIFDVVTVTISRHLLESVHRPYLTDPYPGCPRGQVVTQKI